MIPMASFAALEKRAELLRRLREFFRERGFLEVETPLVADEVIPELHIEPLRLENGQILQASPELAMKCLLAAGATPSSRSSNGTAWAMACRLAWI
jgi:lysyl-tRNA synthetase class 2